MVVLELRAPAAKTGLRILEMATGDRINVIPGECVCRADGGEELAEKVRAYAKKTGLPYTAEFRDTAPIRKDGGTPSA